MSSLPNCAAFHRHQQPLNALVPTAPCGCSPAYSLCLCDLIQVSCLPHAAEPLFATLCTACLLCWLQVETGNPYMLYKDTCNRKSNQQNLGTIKCSNLCTEIIEYSSPEESAVCNLASIALPR